MEAQDVKATVNSKKKSTDGREKYPNCAVKTAVDSENSKQKNKRKEVRKPPKNSKYLWRLLPFSRSPLIHS